jgi:hypothetical protein
VWYKHYGIGASRSYKKHVGYKRQADQGDDRWDTAGTLQFGKYTLWLIKQSYQSHALLLQTTG